MFWTQKNANIFSLFTKTKVSLPAILPNECCIEAFQNPRNSPTRLLLYLAAKPEKITTEKIS